MTTFSNVHLKVHKNTSFRRVHSFSIFGNAIKYGLSCLGYYFNNLSKYELNKCFDSAMIALILMTFNILANVQLILFPSCMKLWTFVLRRRLKSDTERHTFEDYWKKLGLLKECSIHTFELNWREWSLCRLSYYTMQAVMLLKCHFNVI